MSTNQALVKVLTDSGLAQFGDALVNFAISIALTEQTGRPRGTKVPDKVLAEAAVQAGLRKYLPKRLGRGEVANSVEALLGHAWLTKVMTLEEISASLRAANLTQADSFAKLAGIALSRFKT